MFDKVLLFDFDVENLKFVRRLFKYLIKGSKRFFVDFVMKDVIILNLKMVLGKLGNVIDMIVKWNKEFGGENVI